MSDITEVKRLIEAQGTAFEAFKAANDQQLAELKKGVKDPVLEEKIGKIDKTLSDAVEAKEALDRKLNERLDEVEKKLNRPGGGGGGRDLVAEAKELASFNAERKSVAMAMGKPTPGVEVSADDYRAYKAAFVQIVRKGNPDMLSGEERKALQVGVDSDGGYLVPADLSGRIVLKVYETSPIRQIASVQTISSDSLEGLNDLDEASAGWTGETSTRSETNTPAIGKWSIPAHEMYASPKATQKIIDDAAVDVEAWLTGKISEKLARLENVAFVTGNGIAKPRGFTDYTTAATDDGSRSWGQLEHIVTGVNGDFAASTPADHLFSLVGAFKDAYLMNARWVTRREVITKVRKFKESTTNGYIWQPGLQAGQPQQLLGYPVTLAADMPALSSNGLSLAFGDFAQGYQIVDRIGIRVLRDPYTAKPYVIFYTTKRVGGGVLNFEAIKFLKFST